ncbi:MAG: hypothetical protein ABIG89_01020 [Candidatus Woesearchaeota archaeon]
MGNNKLIRNIAVLFVLLMLAVAIVSADKLYIFNKKNEILHVNGHEIIVLEATTNDECLFTIDGEGFVIPEGNEDGPDEVDVYVKKAIPIRSNTDTLYCEILVDVKMPGKYIDAELPENDKDDKDILTDDNEKKLLDGLSEIPSDNLSGIPSENLSKVSLDGLSGEVAATGIDGTNKKIGLDTGLGNEVLKQEVRKKGFFAWLIDFLAGLFN